MMLQDFTKKEGMTMAAISDRETSNDTGTTYGTTSFHTPKPGIWCYYEYGIV